MNNPETKRAEAIMLCLYDPTGESDELAFVEGPFLSSETELIERKLREHREFCEQQKGDPGLTMVLGVFPWAGRPQRTWLDVYADLRQVVVRSLRGSRGTSTQDIASMLRGFADELEAGKLHAESGQPEHEYSILAR